jgi:multidrug resistance efflux pump
MVKSAESALAVAKSELQRTENLVKGGALAARDLEQAKNAVTSAEAQVASAKARQKAVWQQIDDTTVKAPFAGLVNDRPANLGDVVSVRDRDRHDYRSVEHAARSARAV